MISALVVALKISDASHGEQPGTSALPAPATTTGRLSGSSALPRPVRPSYPAPQVAGAAGAREDDVKDRLIPGGDVSDSEIAGRQELCATFPRASPRARMLLRRGYELLDSHPRGRALCVGSSSTSGFTGSYPTCFFFQGSGGGAAGYLGDAGLTVVENGSSLSATFAYGGAASTLDFALFAETAATLAPTPQHLTPVVDCVAGPSDIVPATLSATSGTLTSDSNAVFLSVVGSVAANGGSPCVQAVGTEETVTIVCEKGDGGASSGEPGDAVGAAAASFPTGTFACDALVGSNGPHDQLLSEGAGTLTLSQAGANVTATFGNSTGYPKGALQFVVTSPTSANPVAGSQTLSAPCLVSGPSATGTVNIASGSLTMTGRTLFLSFAGAFDATCQGLRAGGSLACTRQEP
jgi:hypothetical protein